jgi:hypothetical protein
MRSVGSIKACRFSKVGSASKQTEDLVVFHAVVGVPLSHCVVAAPTTKVRLVQIVP